MNVEIVKKKKQFENKRKGKYRNGGLKGEIKTNENLKVK